MCLYECLLCVCVCVCVFACVLSYAFYIFDFLVIFIIFFMRTHSQRQHIKLFYIKVTAAKFAFKMIKLKLIFI